jgi:hypothetical protein
MDPYFVSAISFFFISSGAMTGFYLSSHLPDHHINSESKDAIKMGWGIVATMSALVLSLLVASAKNTFDTVNSECTETSAKIIVLNHALLEYGPQAELLRKDLHNLVAATLKRDWPDETLADPTPTAPQHSNLMQAFHDELSASLTPSTDHQRASFLQAEEISRELATERWLIIEQSKASLPVALFVALVFWLTLLFIGLGLFSPHNKSVLGMLILCSLSVSIAIFLIIDMSHPLRGLVTISSASMRDVFERLSQS